MPSRRFLSQTEPTPSGAVRGTRRTRPANRSGATRSRRRTRAGRGRRLSTWRRMQVAGAAAGLLAALALPWFWGGTGWAYAFADGTAWPNRVGPVLCAVLAVLAAAYLVHRRAGAWLVVLAAATFGATGGLWQRFEAPDVGPGIVVVFLALALLLDGLRDVLRERAEQATLPSIGALVFAYQLVGPWRWVWLLAGAAALAGGAWSLARR